jgi:hypothetical protein
MLYLLPEKEIPVSCKNRMILLQVDTRFFQVR